MYVLCESCGKEFNDLVKGVRYSSSIKEPVQVGKEYEAVITGITRQGDGVTRVRGFVVFVKNAKAGQKVRVKVEKVGSRYATATMAS